MGMAFTERRKVDWRPEAANQRATLLRHCQGATNEQLGEIARDAIPAMIELLEKLLPKHERHQSVVALALEILREDGPLARSQILDDVLETHGLHLNRKRRTLQDLGTTYSVEREEADVG